MLFEKASSSADAALKTVEACATAVFREFAGTTEESRFEKAMEIALRLEGLTVECQRIVPVMFRQMALRDARDEIDLLLWVDPSNQHVDRLAIVIELKVNGIDADRLQVVRYIKSLSQVLPAREAVYKKGLLVSFPTPISFTVEGGISWPETRISTTIVTA